MGAGCSSPADFCTCTTYTRVQRYAVEVSHRVEVSRLPESERVVRESFKELASLGGNVKVLEFLYQLFLQGTNNHDALTLKGLCNIFGLHSNLFVHPWFKFMSGGLDNVTFKEFVHGLGHSCVGRRLVFDMLAPPGWDVIPADVLRRELQALHGRARKARAEEVMAGASKMVAEMSTSTQAGAG
eukprot:CAMPEP_0197595772 /NCGR_PEP_ID=MMETSP1326-20131121/23655_1 /TAXON_ID=1155430 /ORGANISM="Genus nov. species nov., Strain RCC2288" /LENGTH=183 /DNA_ID=CAMNT_0043162175 /DNA_START=173 /DNA_END=720 /DNA_ORIENTATION=-